LPALSPSSLFSPPAELFFFFLSLFLFFLPRRPGRTDLGRVSWKPITKHRQDPLPFPSPSSFFGPFFLPPSAPMIGPRAKECGVKDRCVSSSFLFSAFSLPSRNWIKRGNNIKCSPLSGPDPSPLPPFFLIKKCSPFSPSFARRIQVQKSPPSLFFSPHRNGLFFLSLPSSATSKRARKEKEDADMRVFFSPPFSL